MVYMQSKTLISSKAKKFNCLLTSTFVLGLYYAYVTGFAKTILKGTFCISRNTNLKY